MKTAAHSAEYVSLFEDPDNRHSDPGSEFEAEPYVKASRDWTAWGDQHPVLSTLMQLGIYALIWAAVLVAFGVLAFLVALL